jgi:hypothetical protein
MRRLTYAGFALVAAGAALSAQPPRTAAELRPFIGAYVPSGALRDAFKDGLLVGLQGAFQVRPNVHLLATMGWVPAHVKYSVADDRVSILQFDVGVELGLVRPTPDPQWQFKPYVGLGAGGRTYAYSSSALADKTCSLGYGTIGSELQVERMALRLEARDNVICYRSPFTGGRSQTRNDVGITAGFAYHF